MEKATEVYNKLKLRFVGKGEVAAKPGGESKDQEDNGDMKNTGSDKQILQLISLLCICQVLLYT